MHLSHSTSTGTGRGRVAGSTMIARSAMVARRLVVLFASGLLVSQSLQVVGHLVASRDQQVEQGFLDRVKAWTAGEQDLVAGAVDKDGLVGLAAFVLLGAQDDAECVGEEHGGVCCGGDKVRTEDLVTVEGFVGHCCGLVWMLDAVSD
ncbi:hypothetical protein E4T49_01074 [Aureobasidium sp. EXF-10728]|nr:hypothetical protein E4T49_01074 [Aureobasidium sp. EXF-10728]